jgi:phosphoenolpyruvate carboxylase
MRAFPARWSARRWRAGDRRDDDLLDTLLVTVNGIARGIQNTG